MKYGYKLVHTPVNDWRPARVGSWSTKATAEAALKLNMEHGKGRNTYEPELAYEYDLWCVVAYEIPELENIPGLGELSP